MNLAPNVRVPALFSKAGSNGCAFFLNNSTLVCDGLGRAHIANELLYWSMSEQIRDCALRAAYGSS
jgi:hypothetical protein